MSWSDGADLATILASLVAAAGLWLIWQQLKAQSRQRQLELGNFYIGRYWQIDDDLLLTEDKEVQNRHRRRYLRLTEDEFEAAKLGWLDRGHWSVWHGMFVTEDGAARLRDHLEAVADDDDWPFVSIRACLEQREQAGAGHQTDACAARSLS